MNWANTKDELSDLDKTVLCYVIIVDEHNKPLSYSKSDGQLCYCDDENWEYNIHPIKIVSKRTAKRHIKLDKENRKNKNLASDYLGFKLMPVLF